MNKVRLDISCALRFGLTIALALVGSSTALAARKTKVPPPTPKPAVPQIEKMEPREVTRGTTVTVTGRNIPGKADITVYLGDKEVGVPIRVDVNPDKSGTFMFDVPSDDLPLGRYNTRIAFKQPDGPPIRSEVGVLTVYGDSTKTQPKIAAVNPLLSYPENQFFGFEIQGEGFSTRGSDNVIFREGRDSIEVCWDDDKSCDKNKAGVAHGRLISDRQIILEKIPPRYQGISKIGVRVGVLESPAVAITLSTVEKRVPLLVSLVGFVALFGLVLFVTGRGLRKNGIAGKSHGVVTALLLDKETDTLSLSRLQFFLWTAAAVLGYLYLAVSRSLVQGKLEFVDVPEGLPAIILISASTSVLARGITSSKGPKGAGEVHPSAADLISVGSLVAPERFQFLIWTVIGVFAFLFLVVLQDPGTIKDLPKVPDRFMELMGVSAAGYLGGKLARKPGPVIDEIIANNGSLKLTIRGRNLSQDASFRIGDDDLTSDKIAPPDIETVSTLDRTKPGKPAILEKDSQSDDATMAKALELTIIEPKLEWLASETTLTIINPDGQRATWPYSIVEKSRV